MVLRHGKGKAKNEEVRTGTPGGGLSVVVIQSYMLRGSAMRLATERCKSKCRGYCDAAQV